MSLTYLRGLEIAELKEEDMPMDQQSENFKNITMERIKTAAKDRLLQQEKKSSFYQKI